MTDWDKQLKHTIFGLAHIFPASEIDAGVSMTREYKVDELVEALENGANPDLIVENNPQDCTTALLYSACYGVTDAVEVLLKFGANPNIPSSSGKTSLFFVLNRWGISNQIDNMRMVKSLLEHGANPLYECNAGDTPMQWAKDKKLNEVLGLFNEALLPMRKQQQKQESKIKQRNFRQYIKRQNFQR